MEEKEERGGISLQWRTYLADLPSPLSSLSSSEAMGLLTLLPFREFAVDAAREFAREGVSEDCLDKALLDSVLPPPLRASFLKESGVESCILKDYKILLMGSLSPHSFRSFVKRRNV